MGLKALKIKTWIRDNLDQIVLSLLVIPALALIFTFQLIPSAWTIWFSLTDIALVGKKALNWSFVGLKNYLDMVTDVDFWRSMNVTIQYCAVSLVLRFTVGILAALFMTLSKVKGKILIAAIFLLPSAIPGIMHPYVWISMLEPKYGTLNTILKFFGLPPQSWTYGAVVESLIMINTWAGYTFTMILMASAFKSIPREYYEVAEIYGASRWQKFRKVTLPLIKFPLILCLILIFKEDIDDFTYAYMFTGESPRPDFKTELLSLYAYHKAFHYYELGFGCAVGFVIAIIVFVLTLLQLRVARV